MAARPILNEEKSKVATGLLEYSMLTRGKQDKKNIQSLLVIVAYLVHFSSLFFLLISSLRCRWESLLGGRDGNEGINPCVNIA